MTKLPLYKECEPNKLNKQNSPHKGLWFDKFFNEYDMAWQVPKDGKLKWVSDVAGKAGDERVAAYSKRQQDLVTTLDGESVTVKTDWHFVTGMGNNHPVENGFSWHHTLGVPYLTGAAVKGLLRAWCEQWSDEIDKDTRRRWFGPSFDELNPKKEGAKKYNPAVGEVIFFDALPTGPVTLKADVMTPHYGKWYAEGDQTAKPDGSNLPADWHSPIPIPFLVVDKQQPFQFAVALRPGSAIDIEEVIAQLEEALKYIGAGAKTAAGYGTFSATTTRLKKPLGEVWENATLQWVPSNGALSAHCNGRKATGNSQHNPQIDTFIKTLSKAAKNRLKGRGLPCTVRVTCSGNNIEIIEILIH